MMEGKMHGKKMDEAKMHYEALMEVLAAIGLSLAEFEEKMEKPEMEESEEGGEEYGEEMPEKKPMDKGKIAIIVAKMKNKMKGE
jgi:hypothetical protein